MNKMITIVVSCYNEEDALPQFYKTSTEIFSKLSYNYEIIFINDGSQDGTYSILQEFAQKDKHIKIINFSKNFGHEAAMIAGIDYSKGDATVCMDADLQHPPECLPEIIKKLEEGYDVINMVRLKNESAGALKNFSSSMFYRVINRMADMQFEPNASDFFALSQKAVQILQKNYREKVRFLRGYVQNIGFQKTNLTYKANPRVAGSSKYSMKKLVHFSINTIMSFSNLPLKLGIYAGVGAGILGLILMIYTIWSWITVGTPNGYATTIVLICFMFSLLFMIIGIIGNYIGILFAELKDRPIYIIEDFTNFENFNSTEK